MERRWEEYRRAMRKRGKQHRGGREEDRVR